MQYASNALTYFQSHMFAKLRAAFHQKRSETVFFHVLCSHKLIIQTYALCFKTTNLWIRNIDSKLRCMLKQLVLVVQNRSEGCETACVFSTLKRCIVDMSVMQRSVVDVSTFTNRR